MKTHDEAKKIEALAELIVRGTHAHAITREQATAAAKAVLARFDLAGKGTLDALTAWVVDRYEAGAYMDVGGSDTQAENCAGGICC